jgi:hypothetical protein
MKPPTAITIAAATLALCALAPLGAGAADTMTPEVKLVDDYNTWFLGDGQSADETTLRSELKKYITSKTVLHEVASLPWGGTMVGFDGWVRLGHKTAPIVQKIGDLIEISSLKYYQNGKVVIHEITMTIKGTKEAPEPFVMGIMEKYTVENGKIAQIDEFFADTASFLHRLAVLGALPDKKKHD